MRHRFATLSIARRSGLCAGSSVQALKARGITHVVEAGPGKVLAGLTKRIDAEL